jgi:hypothetical protein
MAQPVKAGRLALLDARLANLILGMKISLNQMGPDDVLEAVRGGQKLAASHLDLTVMS